ncbi:hypothetical protein EVAR_84690_1 [Eumeta japonica]|uniref:Secreted protein n=1 Tax=Eumeta variegata TaxID=151549 RepID=A0A4C1VSN6_EUMVA|nr:hypothetical protein EVAR_84690_1 [Eumeta japonica]
MCRDSLLTPVCGSLMIWWVGLAGEGGEAHHLTCSISVNPLESIFNHLIEIRSGEADSRVMVGCMLHVNACCRQASTMDFRELTPHTIQN